MSEIEKDPFLLDNCKVKCPNCEKVWNSSHSGAAFICILCGHEIDPALHVIAQSENEVN